MSDNPVTQSEFKAFRVELTDYMKQQTKLMSQMVELQTKHSNLEGHFSRLERGMEDFESRLRPLEKEINGQSAKTKYNRDLIWLVLGLIIGVAGYAIKGSL